MRPSALDRLCAALATGLYLSYIPVAFRRAGSGTAGLPARWTGAGFIGTAEGLLLLGLLPEKGLALWIFLAAAGVLGSCICGRAERLMGSHDDPRIILDEVVGFWAAVAFLPRSAALLAAGFVLFRVLDAFKPPPCRWLERLPGGWGVMADDVGAGLYANLLIRGWLAMTATS